MPDIKIYTELGVIIAHHLGATLEGMDVADNPIMADYASVMTPEGEREYHGRMLIEVIHEKRG